jgi:hypothetical protein
MFVHSNSLSDKAYITFIVTVSHSLNTTAVIKIVPSGFVSKSFLKMKKERKPGLSLVFILVSIRWYCASGTGQFAFLGGDWGESVLFFQLGWELNSHPKTGRGVTPARACFGIDRKYYPVAAT